MSEKRSSPQQVIIYLLLVFALSSVFYFLVLRGRSLGAGAGLYVFGIMWCPALAGMATLKLSGRNLAELGWKWPEKKYAIQSWLIPLLYATIAYAIVWGARLGGFPNGEFMDLLVQRMGLRASPIVSTLVYILLAGSFGVVKSMASALGEEIGWRGFLVPELFKNIGFTGTALISGVVWSCWHYPLLIWSELQQWYANLVWAHLFHSYGDFHFFCIRVDEIEVRESMDRSSTACQPQSVHSRHFYSPDPQYRENRLVHRRIRRGRTTDNSGLCNLLLAQTKRTNSRGIKWALGVEIKFIATN